MDKQKKNRWLLLTGSVVLGTLAAFAISSRLNKQRIRRKVRSYDSSVNTHGTDYFFSGEEESADLAEANRPLSY